MSQSIAELNEKEQEIFEDLTNAVARRSSAYTEMVAAEAKILELTGLATQGSDLLKQKTAPIVVGLILDTLKRTGKA